MSEPLSDEELADLRDSLAATDPGPEDTETRLFATIDVLREERDRLKARMAEMTDTAEAKASTMYETWRIERDRAEAAEARVERLRAVAVAAGDVCEDVDSDNHWTRIECLDLALDALEPGDLDLAPGSERRKDWAVNSNRGESLEEYEARKAESDDE